MSGWQPIETAPKDGRLILALCNLGDGQYEEAIFWEEPNFIRRLIGIKPGWRTNVGAYGGYVTAAARPTHWQPTSPHPEATP
jgi:hypothetical protein